MTTNTSLIQSMLAIICFPIILNLLFRILKNKHRTIHLPTMPTPAPFTLVMSAFLQCDSFSWLYPCFSYPATKKGIRRAYGQTDKEWSHSHKKCYSLTLSNWRLTWESMTSPQQVDTTGKDTCWQGHLSLMSDDTEIPYRIKVLLPAGV